MRRRTRTPRGDAAADGDAARGTADTPHGGGGSGAVGGAPPPGRLCCCRWRGCCGRVLLRLTLLGAALLGLWGVACAGFSSSFVTLLPASHPLCRRPNVALMRFFRDLARHKARRRLHHDSALATLVLGGETILQVPDHADSGDGTAFTMTAGELADMDGEDGRPLYLAIRGRVYDVSGGRHFYGKGRSYHHFVGRDASRAFATGCTQPACLVANLDGLSASDRKEVDRWVELYEFHDKYSYVGRLVSEDPVGDAVDRAMREEASLRDAEQDARARGADVSDELFRRGRERYLAGALDEAAVMWRGALARLGAVTEQHRAESPHGDEAWAKAMLRRAKILGLLAAVAQKRGGDKDLEEALERFAEAQVSAADVVKSLAAASAAAASSSSSSSSAASSSCKLTGKAWKVRASSASDRAAVLVMMGKGMAAAAGEHQDPVRAFRDALSTYKEAYRVAVEGCGGADDDGGGPKLARAVRAGWINAVLNTALALKAQGALTEARRMVVDNIVGDVGGTADGKAAVTVITAEEAAGDPRLLGVMRERATTLMKQTAAEVEED